MPQRRRNKYGAKRTEYKGLMYDSKLEANVARELDRVGYRYRRQVSIKFASGIRYVADFVVTSGDLEVVLEVKGRETDVWRVKRRLFLHEYPDIPLVVVHGAGEVEKALLGVGI